VQHITGLLSIINFIPVAFAPVLAAVICAPIHAAWTHIIISNPSQKMWFRRMPSLKVWKKVAAPTALLAFAEQSTIFLPIMLAKFYNIENMNPEDFKKLSCAAAQILIVKILSIVVFGLFLGLTMVLPAHVVLTRVQASLLSDDEETIVPFDRSFGGKVVPEIVGGTAVVSGRDAWKTFDWNSRIRLVKAYAKVFAMQLFTTIIFASLLYIQLITFFGKDLKKLLPTKNNDVIIN